MDRVRNEEVRRRAGIEGELASRADQRVLRWFGHVERMNDELKLIIDYKNKRVNQLVMNNNPTKKTDSLQQTNVIYEFSCPKKDCKLLQNIKYIGMTSTTLSRRLTCHLSSGGPKQHMEHVHHECITRPIMTDNINILRRFNDPVRLGIAEALFIEANDPATNLQGALFKRKKPKLFG